jgi:septum formation protein
MVLGKPKDETDAKRMLLMLSGRTHQVFTGVTVRGKYRSSTFVEETRVTFRTLSESEIDYYLGNYRPYDKAGSYGIQEWIGLTGIERIDGCYFNVMGLPVRRLYEKLMEEMLHSQQMITGNPKA